MGDKTGIQWTDATWNPVRGCSRVSQGCVNCYAETMAGRFCGPGQPYEGLAERRLKTLGEDDDTSRLVSRWTGKVRMVPEHLDDPLRWKKPRRIFVNSMSDLFHEGLTDLAILTVFAIMARAPQHQFQVLTKRPARMRSWFAWAAGRREHFTSWNDALTTALVVTQATARRTQPEEPSWPLRNVWLGVSVEDQAAADERIPLLLDTPAAVRFVSYEPALGPVNLRPWLPPDGLPIGGPYRPDAVRLHSRCDDDPPRLDWIIVGGESGPGARPFDVQWAWDTVRQCKEAGVACFVKQLGSNPVGQFGSARDLITGKGDDPDRWPRDLRVQEFPGGAR